jgi:hypothetical protein
MSSKLVNAMAVAIIAGALAASAQEPRQPLTAEERIVALERQLASLETRFGLESTRPPNLAGETPAGLAARVDAVERSVERLASEVARVARVADNAARDASQAQRDASAAQQAARDAALRAR